MKVENQVIENERALVIAINLFDESKSRILLENAPEDFKAEDLRIDLSEFIGQGVRVGACSPVDSVEKDGETYVTLDHNGRRRSFICFDYFREFPLIEGVLDPGIYSLEEGDGHYYSLHSNQDVSNAFNELPTYYEIEKFKLVCSPGKIIWQWIGEGEGSIEYKRHAFSFFDLHCPVCETKISGYETEGANPTCRIVERRCPHYAGAAFYDEDRGGYEKAGLKRLNFNYKFVADELLLEKPDGAWERPVVFEYGPGDDSFSAGTDDEGVERFLFVSAV